VTLFVVLAGLMAAAGIALLAWPLLRKPRSDESVARFAPGPSVVIAAVAVVGAVTGLYPYASNWHWQDAERADAHGGSSVDAMVDRLEQHLRASPDDVSGWLLLGRSYTARNEYYRAADAYEHADKLTNGENVDALLGLGEALALADQTSLNGKAGELVEKAVRLAPDNPTALWWSGAAAYQRNELALARSRWQQLLAANPPPEIAQVINVKISEIDRQIGPAGNQPGPAASGAGEARVRVRIDLAPELQANSVQGALFVLARHAGERGPPLAVKRLPLGAWPLDVELTTRDSMMPGRALAPGDEVQVVARISRGGTAIAASGDSYGEVAYHIGKDGLVALRIDKQVQ
jgi:cytochrome c-type biogenesis protein CcmH